MYIVLALVMLLRGFADAILMRSQQAFAAGTSSGYLPPGHYERVFSPQIHKKINLNTRYHALKYCAVHLGFNTYSGKVVQ